MTQYPRFVVFFLLGIIVTSGAFLRFWNLGEPSLWIDEGYTINASQAILEHNYPLLDSGQWYKGWLTTTYLTAGSMSILGFDPFSPWPARLPSVVFGIALILAVFFFAYILFRNSAIALAAAFLTGFSQWIIAWSQQARGYTLLALLVVFILYFAWKFFETKEKRFLFYGIITSVFAYLTSTLSLLVLPVIASWWLIDIATKKQLLRKTDWKSLTFSMIGVFIGALIFFELPIRFTRMTPADILYPTYFQFLFTDLRWLTSGALLATILGFFDKKRFRPVMFAFLSLALPAQFIVQYSPVVQLRYLFPFFPLMIILFSYTIYRAVEIISFGIRKHHLRSKQVLTNIRNYQLVLIIAFALTVAISFPCLQFTPKHPELEWGSPQPDFKAVFQEIEKSRSQADVIISPYAHFHQIYLGEKGFWLLMSLTGRQAAIEKQLKLGRDYYTAAPIVKDIDHFIELLNTQTGFVIIDDMARIRLRQEVAILLQHPKVEMIFESKKPKLGSIWLYKF